MDRDLWESVRRKVSLRASGRCEISRYLTYEERAALRFDLPDDYSLDCMHVIPRSRSRELYYNPDNIVFGYRYFHRHIDRLVDPLTKELLDSDLRILWFKQFMPPQSWRVIEMYLGGGDGRS